MADRIVILNAGRIAQAGTPQAVYTRPGSAFVAAFMGAENQLFLKGASFDDAVDLASGPANAAVRLARTGRALTSGTYEARFRAEAVVLQDGNSDEPVPSDALVLTGRVRDVSYPGGLWRHAIALGSDMVQVDAPHAFAPGTDVRVIVASANLFLFDAQEPSPAAPSNSSTGSGKTRVLEASATPSRLEIPA